MVQVPGTGRRKGDRSRPRADRPVAGTDPVATVLVDTPLAHLDRPFEYLVPADLAEDARPGARVRVRFSGRDHDGFVLARRASAQHEGRLALLRRVVSPEQVLTPAVVRAARQVGDHYGGTLADVLRLAVPPRHARAERSVPPEAEEDPSTQDAPVPVGSSGEEPWDAYPAGPALLRRLRTGGSPWAAWLALPAQPPERDWTAAVAGAVAATLRGGRGAVVVVPDHRDVDRVVAALTRLVGADACVRLTADLGPEARYRAFLKVLRGHARVVVGTRAAAWAPVRDAGLFVCWDDGDDLHQEPRAPYPHVREVLRARAGVEGAGLLVGGLTRDVTLQAWVGQGVLPDVLPAPGVLRSAAPAVVVAGEGHQQDRDPGAATARIPSVAWRALRDGLERGPVLVQVPRQGYVVSLACQDCRTPVRCARCSGPVGVPAGTGGRRTPACRWCGTPARPGQACRSCGSPRLRASGMGELRTAEELGRAFPSVRVISSGGERVVPEVGAEPALVVATPGAEPWAPGGYGAVVLLDGWRLLDRPVLDAGVEALRRWCTAASAARPADAADRPRVVVCGVPPHAGVPAVEALVRWDPVRLASEELAERTVLGLPPVRRHLVVRGSLQGAREVVDALVAAGHLALGEPVADADGQAVVVLREADRPVPSDPGPEGLISADVRAVRAARSARKSEDAVRLVLDGAEGAF
ncbi:primosome assembly protein PriA [Ornithinimicrobium avium]|uniref:Probable replication restart protein PriA n=1 Tax=Ornithinimicrobium avium TaxID=2283195 RepID=A0A345NS26_9MICO|nr:primosome assembly protein PriA [Ornithinimicrobium avium]